MLPFFLDFCQEERIKLRSLPERPVISDKPPEPPLTVEVVTVVVVVVTEVPGYRDKRHKIGIQQTLTRHL